jgi:hypothetical protein
LDLQRRLLWLRVLLQWRRRHLHWLRFQLLVKLLGLRCLHRLRLGAVAFTVAAAVAAAAEPLVVTFAGPAIAAVAVVVAAIFIAFTLATAAAAAIAVTAASTEVAGVPLPGPRSQLRV